MYLVVYRIDLKSIGLGFNRRQLPVSLWLKPFNTVIKWQCHAVNVLVDKLLRLDLRLDRRDLVLELFHGHNPFLFL